MDGDREHLRVFIKHSLGSVAVMHVPVDDRDSLGAELGLHVTDGDRDVVEDAEALAPVRYGVVAWGTDERISVLDHAPGDGLDRSDCAAGSEQRNLEPPVTK